MTLAGLVDQVIPPDAWPGGWDGGVRALLEREPLSWARALLERAAAFDDVAALSEADPEAFDALLRVCFEGYYAARHGFVAPAFDMLGFPLTPVVEPEPLPVVTEPRGRYDAVIVGAGAGGGVTACVLAEAGLRVLVVERARRHSVAELRDDHLHGKRAALYDPVAGPGPGHPRVVDGALVDVVEDPWTWGLNAMTLGGGTRVWQGMAWRFCPEDFEMASRYGVPDGSTLSDWPIGYDDLAPYYDRVEWEIGVSGASSGPLTDRFARARDYPMPPLRDDAIRVAFGAAAERLGWGCGPVPFAINSVPRDGRAACVHCSQCLGHACVVDAKNGTQNTMLPRALATGNCDLLVGAQVVGIEHAGGRARGVRLAGGDVVACSRVVVSAGAIETPRLLLASGLGNDVVGTNLHNHAFVMLYGTAAAPLEHYEGPGHSVATLDFVHRDGEAWGGGVLFDAPALLPLTAAAIAGRLGYPAWGAGHKAWMRDGSRRIAGGMGIGQEIPSARSRVTLDAAVRDVHGMPVARLQGDVHPATGQVRQYMAGHLHRWLDEIGIERRIVFGAGRPPVPAGEHSAGTCRMGDDPATSACDRFGRVHGCANVYVADASLLPTNGSVNPCETTMANAWRVAEALSGYS
jgi:choline dehydrogenase-like flavoprotein